MKPKYIPDMATVLRETDPAQRKRNRELAKESLERPTPPLFFKAAQPAEEARGSAPSPWAEEGAGSKIDAAALPSAMAPAVETAAVPAASDGQPRIVGKHVLFAIVAGLMVAVVAVGMPALVGREVKPKETGAAATATASAIPSATATASAIPSACATTSATAAASATPAPERLRPTGTRSRPNGGDPYGDGAPVTVKPTATPVPAPSAAATAAPSASAPDPLPKFFQ